MKSIESSKTIDPGQKSIDSIDSVNFSDWISKHFRFHFSGVDLLVLLLLFLASRIRKLI